MFKLFELSVYIWIVMEKSIGHIRKYVFVYMYMALYAHRISLVQNIYTSTRPTSKPDKAFNHDMVSIFGDDNATDQQNKTKQNFL